MKGNKILLFSFFVFFRHLIKSSSLPKNCMQYKEFITVFVSFTWEWKNFFVKLHKTWCLYFPFLFSSSVMQSFFLFPASSLFGTQQQLTHPPIKSSILPTRKMPVFRGVVPWNTIFTSSCVNSLWDSATLERNIMVYHKKVSDYTTFTLMITWSFLGTLIFKQCHF